MVIDLFIQLGLDGVKQVLIENDRLLPFEDFALESDLADIESDCEADARASLW